ncbi:MAG: rare lipoprotein [Thermoleophilaceae bacterium]|nr:rare lipoprotein [Thermoleophilaceae bacterium]
MRPLRPHRLRAALAVASLLLLAAPPPAGAATLGQRVLARGDHGGDVSTLQRVLAMKSYRVGAADGIFGRHTKAAVTRFQRRAGLAVDGRVGPQTTGALAWGWNVQQASFFGPGLYGNRTACGQVLTPRTRGIAHRSLPCGTAVPVYHDGLIAIFRVIDRGPYVSGVSIDLTYAAARRVGVSSTTAVRATH